MGERHLGARHLARPALPAQLAHGLDEQEHAEPVVLSGIEPPGANAPDAARTPASPGAASPSASSESSGVIVNES